MNGILFFKEASDIELIFVKGEATAGEDQCGQMSCKNLTKYFSKMLSIFKQSISNGTAITNCRGVL